ncbi:MAG: helix-turn-helix domain-containing protein [Lachnospiraceae bacterium]
MRIFSLSFLHIYANCSLFTHFTLSAILYYHKYNCKEVSTIEGNFETNIGNQIRLLLEQEGLSQKDLANEMNISPTTLNGYIRNRRMPDARTLLRLSAYFHTTVDYICGLTEIRDSAVCSYNEKEQQLIQVYRSIPDERKPLFIETGKLFSETKLI